MKKKKILGGILCIGTGAVIGLALPVWFGSSIFKYVNSSKNFSQKMEEIENSSHYQQVYENDKENLEDKYNNKLITSNELIIEKDKLGTIEYKMDYFKNYLPDEYEGILKCKNDIKNQPLSITFSSVILGTQFILAPVIGFALYVPSNGKKQQEYSLKDYLLGSMNYPIAVGVKLIKQEVEAKKSLKKEPDDLPLVDLK